MLERKERDAVDEIEIPISNSMASHGAWVVEDLRSDMDSLGLAVEVYKAMVRQAMREHPELQTVLTSLDEGTSRQPSL